MFQIGGKENKNKNKNGFTLMEVLIAISIFMIILSIAIAVSKSFSNTVDLDNAAKVIGTNIKLAKTSSISALNDTNYGVHFESDQIIVFEGDVFVSGDSANKIINLSDEVEIFSFDLAENPTASGYNIVFSRLTGVTDNFGTVEIRLVKKPSEIKQIVINQEGQVDYVLFQTSSASPITNARHVHYDLGWSIENHETLRLEWTGSFGTIINDIDTAAYFNGSEFDWYGTTTVDGTDQLLRIRSWLGGANTILCIIRDQTEEHTLNVYFYDGVTEKKITTYTAGAGGTVNVSPDSFYVSNTIIK